MLTEFFILWSFWFWVLIAAECGVLFWCISFRSGFIALASLGVFLAIIQLFSNFPVFSWMWEHWETTLMGIGVYLVTAAPWAILKWWLFVRDNSYRYMELLEEFIEENKNYPKNANEFTSSQKVAWKDYFDRNSYSYSSEYERVELYPKAKEHKSDIMTWMIFWPWSFIWTLLNDPIRKLFKNIYRFMVGWLDKISAAYWKDKEGHMPTKEEIEENRWKKDNK